MVVHTCIHILLHLTCVIRLFSLGYFDKANTIYINWDGSHDNVNYTCLYGLIHLLLMAAIKGWPLKKFILLRLPVGHTHVLLDAAWGLLAIFVYGIHSRGDARRDILNWEQLEDVCKTVFGSRLRTFEHLQGCFDFDAFMEPYKKSAHDAGTCC